MKHEEREISYDFPIIEEPTQIGEHAHQDQPDGSSIIYMNYNKAPEEYQDLTFNANLALALTDQQLQSISGNLCDAIQNDKDSREQWETRIVTATNQLGFKPGTSEFEFEGGPTIYSGVLAQTLLEASAALFTELLPSGGPAKIQIMGDQTDELQDKANRVEDWINYYCAHLDKSFINELKLALLWSPWIGSSFVKVYKDPLLNRPCVGFIEPQNGIVNYGVSELSTATRFTHVFTLSGKELRLRQIKGIYKDTKIFQRDDLTSEESEIREEIDSIEGVESIGLSSGYNEKFIFYECYTEYDLPGFEDLDEEGNPSGLPLPYIFTIDTNSKKILSIYRNWKEGDPNFTPIQHFVHFKYWQGLGFYGLGLAQVCGGSAEAATDLTRQLIVSAKYQNFSGGVRAKGLRLENNTIMAGPGEFVQVDLGDYDDIRKVMMPFPTNGPSPALKELKDDLEENIRRLAGSGTRPLAEFNPSAPVGTTLALMEQAQRLQSSTVKEAHRAMGEVLQLMYNIFGETLPEQPYPYKIGNDKYIMRQDFTDEYSVVPISDPNLATSTQRLMRIEAIKSWAQENPDLFDKRAIYEIALREMKITDIDKILLPRKEEEEEIPLDPISENQNAMIGKPLKANIMQDHKAHILVHQSILPMMQQQQIDPSSLSAHIREHQSMQYLLDMEQALGQQLPDNPSQLPIEVQNQIAMHAADILSQQQQQTMEQQPAPPMDPTIAMLEDVKVKAMGIESKSQIEMEKLELEKLKLSLEYEKVELERSKQQYELEQNKINNETRIQIEQMRLDLQALKSNADIGLKARAQDFKEFEKEHEILKEQLPGVL